MSTWNKVLSDIVKQFSAKTGAIHRLNPNDDCLYMIAHTDGIPENIVKNTSIIPLGKGIAGNTAKNKTPTVIGNLISDTTEFVIPVARSSGTVGMACVPIFDDQEVVGTLSIGCFEERQFTEQEISNLLKLGRELAKQLVSEGLQ